MKKIIIYIALIALCSFLIIYILYRIENPPSRNGFKRKVSNIELKLKNITELPNTSFGFVGKSGSSILLKSYTDPLHLFKIDSVQGKFNIVNVDYPPKFNINAMNIYKDILASNLYFTNEFGDVSTYDGSSASLYKIKGLRFDNVKAISPRSLVVRARTHDQQGRNRMLVKLELSDSLKILKKYLFPDQINGVFSNDGWLAYDRKHHLVLYMYFYRGEILTLDTNLHLITKYKTIDTVSSSQIKIGFLTTKDKEGKASKQITQTTPPRLVNKFITINGDKMYILSLLKADNEVKTLFKTNQSVDVYDINSGKYQYSFYIPKYKEQTINEFQIDENRISVIAGNYLVTYEYKL